jgi:hypothetical protein
MNLLPAVVGVADVIAYHNSEFVRVPQPCVARCFEDEEQPSVTDDIAAIIVSDNVWSPAEVDRMIFWLKAEDFVGADGET